MERLEKIKERDLELRNKLENSIQHCNYLVKRYRKFIISIRYELFFVYRAEMVLGHISTISPILSNAEREMSQELQRVQEKLKKLEYPMKMVSINY